MHEPINTMKIILLFSYYWRFTLLRRRVFTIRVSHKMGVHIFEKGGFTKKVSCEPPEPPVMCMILNMAIYNGNH